jgi:aspartate aminotransferase
MTEKLDDPDFVRRVYPEGLTELRQAIAEHYCRRYAAVSADNVIVNTGTSPIFRNIFQLVSGPEYEIMIPRPYYALYLYCATLARANVKFYDIDIDTKRVDMDSFRRNFSPERTSLVVINSPGNPIGNIVTPEEMREMYDIIDHNAHVLNDDDYPDAVVQRVRGGDPAGPAEPRRARGGHLRPRRGRVRGGRQRLGLGHRRHRDAEQPERALRAS